MRRTNKIILAALAGSFLPAAAANAGLVVLGTSSTVAPTSNPSVSLTVGQSTTLYIWARPTGNRTDTNLRGFGFNVAAVGATGAVSAADLTTTGFDWANDVGDFTNTTYNVGNNIINDARTSTTNNTSYTTAAGLKVVGQFTITATTAGTVPLFFVAQSGFVEGPAGVPANFGSTTSRFNEIAWGLGFGSNTITQTRATSGYQTVSISGVDTASAASGTLPSGNTLQVGNRSATADATITIVGAQPTTSITATAGGTGSIPVTGAATSFVAGTDSAAPYVFNFTGANTGSVIASVLFTAAPGSDITGLSSYLGSNPAAFGLPAPAAGQFAAVFNLGSASSLGTSPFTVGLTGFSNVASVSVIPEPTGFAVLGLLALPALRRNRRA